ncbi:MAG: class I SAM-dependent methyltransferase [Thermoproteota archaeon]|nr:class I SAM-dependent methyltransferase [Candidatus Brockarchaeota archaeon]
MNENETTKMKTKWNEVIRKTYEKSRKLGVPSIDLEDGYVLFSLAYLTALNLRKLNAIDAGAGVGFSTIWIAKALEDSEVDGKIYAIEEDSRRFDGLRELVLNYKFQDKVIPIEGNALELIEGIKEEINFIFIDIDKHLYLDLFKLVKDKIQVGGLVLAHNVNHRWGTIEEFIEEASKDGWKTTIAPTPEGISISFKVS